MVIVGHVGVYGEKRRRNEQHYTDQMLNTQYQEGWSHRGARSLRSGRERRFRKYFKRASSGSFDDQDGNLIKHISAVDVVSEMESSGST